MVMAMNSEYRGSASGAAAAKKKAAMKKTVVTPGTKVSQATIDKIKAMGMTKALKSASSASPEMREGLKRLYGAKRVAAAAPSKPAAKSPDQARGAMSAPSKPVYKSADAARAAMPGKGPMVKVASAKPVKKSGTTDPLARAIFGAAKAIRGGSNQGMTAAQVAAENKRRIAAAKKNK
jgi:DNA-binding protein HU-beta